MANLCVFAGAEKFVVTDNVAVSTDISVGLNRMNCTGEESMLTECESAYENSTAGCNKRAVVQCHEESK